MKVTGEVSLFLNHGRRLKVYVPSFTVMHCMYLANYQNTTRGILPSEEISHDSDYRSLRYSHWTPASLKCPDKAFNHNTLPSNLKNLTW